jgi:hypothetical protein
MQRQYTEPAAARCREHSTMPGEQWSLPSGPRCHDYGELACWRPVGKKRRISRFALASGRIVTHAAGLVHESRCDVELTEVRTRDQEWWSLGFEATGPADLLHSALAATAALVFARALPGLTGMPLVPVDHHGKARSCGISDWRS